MHRPDAFAADFLQVRQAAWMGPNKLTERQWRVGYPMVYFPIKDVDHENHIRSVNHGRTEQPGDGVRPQPEHG